MPGNLDALVPQFVTTVPEDPFRNDDGPISYIPREDGGFVIYSWGHNRTDDKAVKPEKGSGWINGDGTFTVASPAFRNGPQLTDVPPEDNEQWRQRSRNATPRAVSAMPPLNAEPRVVQQETRAKETARGNRRRGRK